MSEQEGKKPGARDISDLKARLGLKKNPRAEGASQVPRGPGKAGYVPPPPGVAPSQPSAPVVPDARNDPFGAMNAMAAQGAVARAPEIIVVDKQHVEQVAPQSNVSRYAKVAGLLLAPLVVGFLLGGINNARSQYNANLRDAAALTAEFNQLGQNLEGLSNVLLSAKERGPDQKSYAFGDKQLLDELERANFTMADADQLILYHRNLYLLEPKLVQDTLQFYSRMRVLSQKVKEHTRLTKDMLSKLAPEARTKLGAQTGFGAVVHLPSADETAKGARPTVDMVQLGLPICGDGKPAERCPDAPTGFMVRTDTSAQWQPRPLASSETGADKLYLFAGRGNVLNSLLEGSPRFLDELQYYQRLGEIDALVAGVGGEGGLVKERRDIQDRLNAVAKKSKAFAI